MRYIIKGVPQQQERPRATIMKGRIVIFDPPKSKAYKKYLASEIMKLNPLYSENPLKVIIDVYVPIPKSYTKKKKQMIKDGLLFPNKKPDLSNFIKLIEDAMNGILYKDDGQIIELNARKLYSDDPRIEMEIIEI